MHYPTNHVLGSRRNGLNLVSMNMGSFDRNAGPVRGSNYPLYSDALFDWFKNENVKSVRVMFTWEAVQSSPGGAVPSAATANYANYWADLRSVVTRLLARGIYVILSPWQFNPASGDTDIVYDGAAFAAASFADFWGKFAAAINGATGNDPRVAFDLINEPHTHAESGNRLGDIGISLADWFACAQAAITAIRSVPAANTIFVPGMAYAAASSFTTNGSSTEWLNNLVDQNIAVTVHCYSGLGSASVTVLRDACSAVVDWARLHDLKVNIGEIAINAGSNGRPQFCSTFAIATAQWADWTSFCAANEDVLTGWNWWANSAGGAWWNQGDSCDTGGAGFHWGLTLDNGATPTVYMNLIKATLPVPLLQIRDNATDTGVEPNATTNVAWESPDVWARQSADGGTVGQDLQGGQPAAVYVKVSNRGLATSDDNAIVHLYWAKASAGLSYPKPWDGSVPQQGGAVAPPQPAGAILPGQTKTILFNWAATPNPSNFGNDGHFCLLAMVVPAATTALFPEFEGSNLNQNVLKLGNVAWRNIHIVRTAKKELGDLVVANLTDARMLAQVGFEVLGDAANAQLSLTPKGAALDKIREHDANRRSLEDLGHGTFRVLDPATGIPHLDLLPGEVLRFALESVPERDGKGHAVRATQFALEGGTRTTNGGQTFVAGEVEGFTKRPPRLGRGSCGAWVGAFLSLLVTVLLRGARKK